jgi:hypothetical protein
MVPKRAVVRMLHDAHDLNYIVSQLDYSGEDCFLEIGETVDLGLDATHSNVAFINFYVFIFPTWFGMFPLILSQFDVDSVEGKIDVLCGEVDPGRDSVFNLSVLELHLAFNL